jgi:hypothetical protein
MNGEMSGKQLAEVLRFLANKVQETLDDTEEVRDQLQVLAAKLEEKKRHA